MIYPRVLSEDDTIARAARGLNLSRFGDGELRLAAGGASKSQRELPRLVAELREILWRGHPNCLACIPRVQIGPRAKNWQRYEARQYVDLYGDQLFGSAFISRPDSAPWIDVPAYWASVRKLWAGEEVTLVIGNDVSLTAGMLREARSVRTIYGPAVDAYAEIDALEESIGEPGGVVILCLGATATVLAWRLARKRVKAHDLGHAGMFMKKSAAAA